MARGLNKVMLIGNLGRDAETRHTQSGTAVTNFTVATARRYKDAEGNWRDATDWHDVVLWRGDRVAPYLRKGTQVYVEGRLQTRSYEDQSGQKRYRTEVVCDSFGLMLLGSRDGGGGSQGGPGGYQPGGGQDTGYRSSGGQGGGFGSGGGQRGRSPGGHDRSSAGGGSGMGDSPVDDDDIPF